MGRFRTNKIYLLLLLLMVMATSLRAQITAVGYYKFTKISKDTAYIFCTTKNMAAVGVLTAEGRKGVNSTFEWEKYDTISHIFNPFNGIILYEDTLRSTISGLDDGLYRVNIKSGGNISMSYQAYVLNNWIEIPTPEIPDSSSTCIGFKIEAEYQAAPLRYFDLNTDSIRSLRNPNSPFDFIWAKGSEIVPGGNKLSPYIFPPKADPKQIFKLTITDPFGCTSPETQGNVEYISKVPKTIIDATPTQGEAVLKVTFKNSSINADSIMWCFFKSDSIIKVESERNKGKLIDSIDFVLFDNEPVYEFEWTGRYQVKAITVHENKYTGNCYDTLYLKTAEGTSYIDVIESLVEVPNVFTPGNYDGKNDVFVVKSQSLKSMKIQIYNRWGGLVHSWSYSNIRSRDYTYKHSVWDGKIGGRMASPGVYFYVIRAEGRDGVKQKKNGFVHLFRTKD